MLMQNTAFYAVFYRKGISQRISHRQRQSGGKGSSAPASHLLRPVEILHRASNVFLLLPRRASVTSLPFSLFLLYLVCKSESALGQNDEAGPAAFPSATLGFSVAVDHRGGWWGFAQHLAGGEVDGCMWSSVKWPFWCTHSHTYSNGHILGMWLWVKVEFFFLNF